MSAVFEDSIPDINDPAYLNEQIAVATALQANPVILAYITRQAESSLHMLLNTAIMGLDPEAAKAKLVHVQASIHTNKHYIDLAASLENLLALRNKLAKQTTEE